MTPDTIALIVFGMTAGMVGVIYASIRKQQDALEARHTKRFDKLETKLEAELKDMEVNVRHRVAEMNIQVLQAIQVIPTEEIRVYSERAEMLANMLTRRGRDEVVDLDRARAKESTRFQHDAGG